MKEQSKRTIKSKGIKVIAILVLLICAQYIFTIIYEGENIGRIAINKLFYSTVYANNDESNNNIETKEDPNEGEYIRLTDLDFRPESKAGWDKIRKNEDSNGAKLEIKREGAYYTFDYGIWAHAQSEVYFDVREYSEKYHYLTMYVGLNKTATSGDGVKFFIYTSDEDTFYKEGANHWTIKSDPDKVYLPREEAVFMKIDIRGAKYLRFTAVANANNASDHSVYIDPMLITDNYQEKQPVYPGVEVYDQRIKEYANKDLADSQYELLVLQRKFIDSVGNYALERFIEEDSANKETIDWLMNDVENLRYYILGGTPTGSYYNSLKELTRLLKEYKNDFDDQTQISDAGKTLLANKNLNWPTTKGNLYKRMAITISLTHSSRVGLWMQNSEFNQSDSVNRYALYKQMYNNGQFKATDTVDITPWFEAYNIEQMRWVLGTLIDDEEVIWLNEYTQTRIDKAPGSVWSLLTPHPYMAYVWPNYANPVYYDENNKDYFNDLFAVEKTNEDGTITKKGLFEYVPYRNDTSNGYVYKLWMNFRNKFGTGAVCGGISKSGHCIRGVNAIPSAVIGQPGHAALLYYNQNAEGQGLWGIDNDVSGWALSEKGERMPLGWGNDRTYVKGYNVPYVILAQEALNDYNNFEKAEKLLMTVDTYKDDKTKQEQIYREAIGIQSINLDAWAGLAKLYVEDPAKTEEDCYKLEKEMMEALKCFPFPMHNLSNYIKTKFTSDEYIFKFTILQNKILTEGKNYPNEGSTVLQPGTTRGLAAYLLGQIDTRLATFSFDGADAEKIVLSSRFDGNGIRWDYSLDGKKTWNEVASTAENHKHSLTKEEIASITAENDIYIHIVGTDYSEENIYQIDIQESDGLPATLFANDLENRMIGVTLSTQWRYSENEPWTSYSEGSPDLTGNKTVQLRQGATGTRLASDASSTFTFTEDNQPDTRKYIPVSHLSIHSFSTEAASQGGAATNAIDANYNTRWHSAWNGSDTERYIVIELDQSVTLSAVEFVPAGGGNGKIYDGTIYGSMDGETWEVLANQKNLTYTNQANTVQDAITNTKSFEIEEPKEVKYVKIVADRSNANWFTARAFNLYQDLTKNPHPTAGVAYSTTEKTNGVVIARLVNPSTKITITNNNGSDTYIFSENGNFTFEFEDENGAKGSAEAKVTWIDKDTPTADVKYKLDEDKKIRILLDNISENVYILDENNNKTNYIEVENGKTKSVSYLNSEGETYKIVELDENGNTKKIIYKNTTGTAENVETYVTILKADGTIESEEYFDSEGNNITKTLNDSEKELLRKLQQTTRSNPLEHAFEVSGNYEFRILDEANNISYKSIQVDYINNDTKILASDITYNITSITNKDVIATIKPYMIDINGNEDTNVRILSEGGNSHTFTENGEFTFEYMDKDEDLDNPNKEEKTHTAKVNWIDKIAPTAEIKYSTEETTDKSVIVTLVNESEEIIITNNNASKQYTFNENGEFTFEFEDKAGNKGTATAKVDWIKKEQENPDKYELGDINEDGKITATDLLLVKRHLIAGEKQEWTLTGDKFKAGDINKDGKITATDLLLIKRLVLEQIETH